MKMKCWFRHAVRWGAAVLCLAGGCLGPRTRRVEIPAVVAVPLLAMRDELTTAQRLTYRARGWVALGGTNGIPERSPARYDVLLERPGRLRVESEWAGSHAMLWYDMGRVVVHDVVRGVYADVVGPRTLDAFLDALLDAGVVLPGHDLLYADPLGAMVTAGMEMRHVGEVRIGGRLTDHLLFLGAEQNRELWVARDAPSVPLRSWVDDRRTNDAAQYMLEMSDWEVSAETASAEFIPRSLESEAASSLEALLANWEGARRRSRTGDTPQDFERTPDMRQQMESLLAAGIWRREHARGLPVGYGALIPVAAANPVPSPASVETQGTVDPRVLVQLRRMSDFLVGLEQFRIEAVEVREHRLSEDARVHIQAELTYDIVRPDRLTLRAVGERTDLLVESDGTTCTIGEPVGGGAVAIAAKGTLPVLFAEVQAQYGYALPFRELLCHDVFDRLTGSLSRGRYLGTVSLGGRECHLLSCVGGDTAWQLWVAAEGDPRPCRLQVHYGNALSAPCYSVDFGSIEPADGDRATP